MIPSLPLWVLTRSIGLSVHQPVYNQFPLQIMKKQTRRLKKQTRPYIVLILASAAFGVAVWAGLRFTAPSCAN